MSVLSMREWEVADYLYKVTRDTPEEVELYMKAKALLPGFDRHSYGIVMATPEQIETYRFMDRNIFPEDYNSNLIGTYGFPKDGLPIYRSDISERMREIRSKEGVSLLELTEEPKIIRNGMILPPASPNILASQLGVSDISELFERLNLGEEVGGKIRALLSMGFSHPDIALLRLDGTNYLFKGSQKYDLETGEVVDLSDNQYELLKQTA